MSGPFARPLSGREQRRREARAQRLAASRPALPERRIVRDAAAQLVEMVRPYEPGEKDSQHIKVRLALAALADGTGTLEDYKELATTVAVAFWRATDIDAALAASVKPGCDAMRSCWERHQRTDRWGFSGPELTDVTQALDVSEAVTDASTPLQMVRAAQAAHRHAALFVGLQTPQGDIATCKS